MKITNIHFRFLLFILLFLFRFGYAQENPETLVTNFLPSLPDRPEILIRDATVMTMDETLGEITDGDVHIRNGKIIDVGQSLSAPQATVLDGRGMIVLPGFVETHWHMWTNLVRSMSGDKPEHGYFPMRTELGKAMRHDDNYTGVWLAAAEAIHSGITTVNNWSHNIRSPQHAERELRALRESGLRVRFSYGPAAGQDRNETIDLAHWRSLHKEWHKWSGGGLITLGLSWRGPSSKPDNNGKNAGITEFNMARKLHLPLSIHAGSRPSQAGDLVSLAKNDFLGPDVLVIHATSATDKDINALAESGSPASLSPFTELRIGYGLPPTMRLLDAGVTTSLSVDTPGLSGNADMFAIMKVIQNLANGMAGNEFTLPAQRVIRMATIDGARALGLEEQTGSLTPGKRADLIMVSLNDVNMAVHTRPDHLIVEAAQPANVDTVIIDGRILKRKGKLTAVNTDAVIKEAADRFERLKQN